MRHMPKMKFSVALIGLSAIMCLPVNASVATMGQPESFQNNNQDKGSDKDKNKNKDDFEVKKSGDTAHGSDPRPNDEKNKDSDQKNKDNKDNKDNKNNKKDNPGL